MPDSVPTENRLVFYVNGRRIDDGRVDPRTTLATYLRENLRLKGTKVGCNEGGCGACTVMVSEVDPVVENIRHFSVNACLTPVCAVFGKAVTTVEALGSVVSKRLHPVQERLSLAHGSQCGFCTPGFVMAMYTLLRNNPKPTTADVDECLQGNLCRCTGYRPILEAFYSFTADSTGTVKARERQNDTCPMSEQCCKATGVDNPSSKAQKLSTFDACREYDPSQELIFPPELQTGKWHEKSFRMDCDGMTWYQPSTLDALLVAKTAHENARIIAGNSEVGVEQKFTFTPLRMGISPWQVKELRKMELSEHAVHIGAAVSLSQTKEYLAQVVNKLPEPQTEVLRSVIAIVQRFAGKHVRNTASIAGNLATASPISDLNPIWMAAGASVVLCSQRRGKRAVRVDQHFFPAYRRTLIEPDEVITEFIIPLSRRHQIFRTYKQAQRRDDDIAIVTGSFSVGLDENRRTVKELKMAFGGMAAVTKLGVDTVKGVEGRLWDKKLLEDIVHRLTHEFALSPDAPGGMPQYRLTLVLSFFYRFFLEVAEKVNVNGTISQMSNCQLDIHETQEFCSTQVFQDGTPGSKPSDPVGRPLMHLSGQKHTTGEAIYTDDIVYSDSLHMAYVLSTVTCGIVESVDVSEALAMPGVVGYVDHNDMPGSIYVCQGETLVFAAGKVHYWGQPVGAIVAETHETARRAASLVKVNIAAEKPIITTEEAIQRGSFFIDKPFVVHSSMAIEGYDTPKPFDWSQYDKVVASEVKMVGQEHFYLETHTCLVIPGEDGEMEVVSSTQVANDVQRDICTALGIPFHKVVVRVKRIGGGFGGKETNSGVIATAAAVAARKFKRAVRIVLERYDDMCVTGNRHPFLFKYKFAVGDDGKFLAYELKLFNNGGYVAELSPAVMQKALCYVENAYLIGNVDAYGLCCRTNITSNTAFRGFGAPQAMFAVETVIKHAAEEFGFDADKIRAANLYSEGDRTPLGMQLDMCNVRRCWTECLELADFERRKAGIEEWNRRNKYIKRGLYIVPTKYGIGFGFKGLNQGGALIHIYKDGSVLVTVGGMEMGQGLYTKLVQIAARCLDLNPSWIHINDMSTDKVPNASPTAASASSDMYGLAVQNACQTLMDRLKPIRAAISSASWPELVMAAYTEEVALTATGQGRLYCEQPIDFFSGKGGDIFGYCVYGAACSEVEVDCLTGDHRVLRTDIVTDIGDSLNPAIDIGQIEGAFVQGYGLYTMEEVKFRPDGTRLTKGPGTYKIPSADDAPKSFNVKLLKGSSNPKAIFSSKAVGEPPLFLGCSVFFAIRDAVRAYRMDQGLEGYFRFDSPATPARIRLACEDELVAKAASVPDGDSCLPWTVEL